MSNKHIYAPDKPCENALGHEFVVKHNDFGVDGYACRWCGDFKPKEAQCASTHSS